MLIQIIRIICIPDFLLMKVVDYFVQLILVIPGSELIQMKMVMMCLL